MNEADDNLFTARDGSHFLVLEPSSDHPVDDLHLLVLSCAAVEKWWNFFGGFYIIETSLETSELTRQLQAVLPVRHLLGKVIGEFSGRMHFDQWKFFLNLESDELRKLEQSIYANAAKKIKST